MSTHTWATVKPVLPLEDQLMPDKKAPQRPTDSALTGEHPNSRGFLHGYEQKDPQLPNEPGGVKRLKTEAETIYRVEFPPSGFFANH